MPELARQHGDLSPMMCIVRDQIPDESCHVRAKVPDPTVAFERTPAEFVQCRPTGFQRAYGLARRHRMTF